jgi:beta-fructofuranosidase
VLQLIIGLNDPCAPGYDPRTGLFHLFYQWNPHSHAWDKISWGHATSKDLLHWDHASDDTVSESLYLELTF